jgi:hypothetical protein
MTVLIAVRTASAVVFAADSKLTTSSFAGFDTNGDPLFLPQTYDNAVKIWHDLNKTFMVALAGNVSVGERGVIDFLSQADGTFRDDADQDEYIFGQIVGLGSLRFDYWSRLRVPKDRWPSTALLIATTSPVTAQPRLWRISFEEDRCEADEILRGGGVWLDGSYEDIFCLLYGYKLDLLAHSRTELNLSAPAMQQAAESFTKPVNRINVVAMPIQDAMDLACFLAQVQIEMDRFLPGTARCGGPVDLMVLQGVPAREIKEFPGKVLRHPKLSWQ